MNCYDLIRINKLRSKKKQMNKQRLFTLLCYAMIFATLSGCTKESNTVKTLFGTTISQQKTDDFIDNQMDLLDMNSLSIAIINDGKVVYHRVKGYADKEKQILANTNSIFEGASISKSVFGFFIMTFVEDGLLDLDKPLYKYLPNPAIEYDDRYKKITARMVLSHRSGFPNWRSDYPDKKLFIQFELFLLQLRCSNCLVRVRVWEHIGSNSKHAKLNCIKTLQM